MKDCAAVNLAGVWRQATMISSEGDEVVLEVVADDAVRGGLLRRPQQHVRRPKGDGSVWEDVMRDGEVSWLGEAWGAEEVRAVGWRLRRIAEYNPAFTKEQLRMYNACFLEGEGVIRVGDIVTFTPEEGSRPYVGEVELMFEVEPWACGEDGVWPERALVEAYWSGELKDGSRVSNFYRAHVVRRNKDGTYWVKYEDGEQNEHVRAEEVRRCRENRKYVLARWFYRPEETQLGLRQKQGLLGVSGEVLQSEEADVTEIASVECSRCLLTYIRGDSARQRQERLLPAHNGMMHTATAWSSKDREARGAPLAPLHLCCAFAYDAKKRRVQPVRGGGGEGGLPEGVGEGEGEGEDEDEDEDEPLLQRMIRKASGQHAGAKASGQHAGASGEARGPGARQHLVVVEPEEESSSTSAEGEGEEDKALKARGASDDGTARHRGAAVSANGAGPSAANKSGAGRPQPQPGQPPRPPPYLKGLSFLAKIGEQWKNKAHIPVTLKRGIPGLTRDDRQKIVHILLNNYLRVHDGCKNGVEVSVKKAREAEERVFDDCRKRVLGVEEYKTRMRGKVDRVKKLPKRDEAHEWSDEEEEMEVIDADSEARQQLVAGVRKKAHERKGEPGKVAGSGHSTSASRVHGPIAGAGAGAGGGSRNRSDARPTAGGLGEKVGGAVGHKGKRQAEAPEGAAGRGAKKAKKAGEDERELLKRLGHVKLGISEDEACCAASGRAVQFGIFEAFRKALEACEAEQAAPHLHMEQFESVVNPKPQAKAPSVIIELD